MFHDKHVMLQVTCIIIIIMKVTWKHNKVYGVIAKKSLNFLLGCATIVIIDKVVTETKTGFDSKEIEHYYHWSISSIYTEIKLKEKMHVEKYYEVSQVYSLLVAWGMLHLCLLIFSPFLVANLDNYLSHISHKICPTLSSQYLTPQFTIELGCVETESYK